MRIAFDGGSFQQGIAAGIFNVAHGFLNSATRLDPSFEFVLVADPRLGPIRKDLVDRLVVRPDILFGEVGRAYGVQPDGLVSEDPKPEFIVDDVPVPAVRLGKWICYQGPAPNRSFIIASRSSRPCDVGRGLDPRNLGFCFTEIIVEDEEGRCRNIPYDCEDLRDGYHTPEAGFRWTTGRGVVPTALLPRTGTVQVAIRLLDTLPYRIGGGRFDSAFNRIHQRISTCSSHLAVRELSNRLRHRGATLYFANHFLPAVLPGLKLVAWAHDIIPILFPHFFMQDAIVNFNQVVEVFRQADHIFCVSEQTKKDLSTHLGIKLDRMTVTGIDIGENIRVPEREVAQKVLERFSLLPDLILCVGTLEPRKNHLRLVQAYKAVLEIDGDAPPLVIVGKHGWGYHGVVEEISKLGLERRVHLLENVNDTELSALYSSALFVVYPSLYEGFGLPVLEAMACGRPVLTSRGTSMSEVAGDAAFLVDPYNVTSIADGLVRMIHDGRLRSDLAERGRLRHTSYSWEIVAHRVLEVLRGL